jgi:hypothetical protein
MSKSWFVLPLTKRNTLTANEKIAYDILNTAFEDADASGIPPVLNDILASYEGNDNDVINIIKNQFNLIYPNTQTVVATAPGGRRSTRKTKKTKKSKRSKRGSRRV